MSFWTGKTLKAASETLLTFEDLFAGTAASGTGSTLPSEGGSDGTSEGTSLSRAPVGEIVLSTWKQQESWSDCRVARLEWIVTATYLNIGIRKWIMWSNSKVAAPLLRRLALTKVAALIGQETTLTFSLDTRFALDKTKHEISGKSSLLVQL